MHFVSTWFSGIYSRIYRTVFASDGPPGALRGLSRGTSGEAFGGLARLRCATRLAWPIALRSTGAGPLIIALAQTYEVGHLIHLHCSNSRHTLVVCSSGPIQSYEVWNRGYPGPG